MRKPLCNLKRQNVHKNRKEKKFKYSKIKKISIKQ